MVFEHTFFPFFLPSFFHHHHHHPSSPAYYFLPSFKDHIPSPSQTLLKPTSISTMSRQGYTRLPETSSETDLAVDATTSSVTTSSAARTVLRNVASSPPSASASRANVLESLMPLSKTPWSNVPTIIYTDPSKTRDASGSSSSSASGNTKH